MIRPILAAPQAIPSVPLLDHEALREAPVAVQDLFVLFQCGEEAERARRTVMEICQQRYDCEANAPNIHLEGLYRQTLQQIFTRDDGVITWPDLARFSLILYLYAEDMRHYDYCRGE